jgi:hypothetical protein
MPVATFTLGGARTLMQPKFIRIKPEEPRGSHTMQVGDRSVTFLKGKWYEVKDPAVIAKCERTRTTFENPRSPLLFQIVDRIVAEELHKEETEKVDPTGDPADPIRIERAELEASKAEVHRLGNLADSKLAEAQAERAEAERMLAEAHALKEEAERLKAEAEAAKQAAEAPAAEPAPAEPKGGKAAKR